MHRKVPVPASPPHGVRAVKTSQALNMRDVGSASTSPWLYPSEQRGIDYHDGLKSSHVSALGHGSIVFLSRGSVIPECLFQKLRDAGLR